MKRRMIQNSNINLLDVRKRPDDMMGQVSIGH